MSNLIDKILEQTALIAPGVILTGVMAIIGRRYIKRKARSDSKLSEAKAIREEIEANVSMDKINLERMKLMLDGYSNIIPIMDQVKGDNDRLRKENEMFKKLLKKHKIII